MTSMRIALMLFVVGVAVLLLLWAMGLAGFGDVAGASMRTAAVVAIGGGAAALLFALAGRGGDSGGPAGSQQGPKF